MTVPTFNTQKAMNNHMVEKGYRFRCGSPSNRNGRKGWLCYKTLQEAEAHRDRMNKDRLHYSDPYGNWDRNFWPYQPEPWIVEPMEIEA